MKIRCVVACTASDGTPDFYGCVVEVSQEQYDEGAHYDAARFLATEEDYEGPMVVYDEKDGPAFLFRAAFPEDEPGEEGPYGAAVSAARKLLALAEEVVKDYEDAADWKDARPRLRRLASEGVRDGRAALAAIDRLEAEGLGLTEGGGG